MTTSGKLQFILPTIIILNMTLGVVLQDTNPSDTNLTSFDPSRYPPVQGDLRFAGSSGLFFLHLLKHKLYKLRELERIQTTTGGPPGCICVPYYLCDINNNIILTGMLGPLDIRSRQCTGNFEVCCYLRIIPTTVRPTMMPPPTMMTPRPTMMTPRPTMMTPLPTIVTPRPTMMTPRPTMMITLPPFVTLRPTMMTLQPTQVPTRVPTQLPTVFPANYCVCVYTFQCVNGYIVGNPLGNYPGSGAVNPRQNQVCLLANQICCRPFPFPNVPSGITTTRYPTQRFPSLDPRPNTLASSPTLPTWPQVQNQIMSPGQMSPQAFPNFMPGQTCICIPSVQCNVLGYFPIVGSGSFNPMFGMNSLLPVGSACPSVQETCCRIIFSQTPGPQLLSADSQVNNNNQDIRYPGTQDACRCAHSSICPGDRVVYPEGYEGLDPGFGVCSNEGEVCCRINGFEIVGRVTTVAAAPAPGLGSSLFFDNQCGYSTNIFAPEQPFTDTSGRTYFAEFPWMVAILLRYFGEGDSFLCGGSMINSKIVLTAGHCLENRSFSNLVARFGEWDTRTTEEPLPFQEAEVESVIIHPQFFNAALYHDVAILILKNAVTYSINVMPICLPFQGQEFPSGTRCFATGWGRSAFGTDGEYQSVLRKIDLPLINNDECQNRLRATRLGAYFQLHGSFICAGGEGSRDTCRGDGGGPLVCPMSSGQYVQVGIISWGIGCGTRNPAVYASVAKDKSWIDEQIATYGV